MGTSCEALPLPPRWEGEEELRRAGRVSSLRGGALGSSLTRLLTLQASPLPSPPARAPLPKDAPRAVPPPSSVLRERQLLSSWARVSSIDPAHKSKLAQLVSLGPPGAPGCRPAPACSPRVRAPRSPTAHPVALAARSQACLPPPPSRLPHSPPNDETDILTTGSDVDPLPAKEKEIALKLGEQESATRQRELSQLARMERVAAVLKSEFRADLEQLISIHSELIAHGISQVSERLPNSLQALSLFHSHSHSYPHSPLIFLFSPSPPLSL